MVLGQRSDELVSSYANSSKAKEAEAVKIKGKHCKRTEYWGRKQQRLRSSNTSPRDSPRLSEKEPNKGPGLGGSDLQREKQSLDSTLEVEEPKNDAETYNKKDYDVKNSKEFGKCKSKLHDAKFESLRKGAIGKGNVANTKGASVNRTEESCASLENASVTGGNSFLVEDKGAVVISRKDLGKRKDVGKERKDSGSKGKKELSKGDCHFFTEQSSCTSGREINEHPRSKAVYKAECFVTETQRNKDIPAFSSKKRERRQRSVNKKM